MNTKWSHLPNAHHIDWMLASLKENQELWSAAWSESRFAVRPEAWDEAWNAAKITSWDSVMLAAWDTIRIAAKNQARSAGWSAGVALIYFADCDQFLSMSYERLKVWAVLSEDPCAILLLPMIYVKEKLNEQCMVTLA